MNCENCGEEIVDRVFFTDWDAAIRYGKILCANCLKKQDELEDYDAD